MWGCAGSPAVGVPRGAAARPDPRVCPAAMAVQRSHRLNLLCLLVLLVVALAGVRFLLRDR